MELDLETCLTTLYVLTGDLYQACVRRMLPNTGGPAPRLSDAEVLCLGLAAQWRSGVPWHSERRCVRYALKHLRSFFPGMTSQSAFKRRLRRLWGAFMLIEQAVGARLLEARDGEVRDCVPVAIAPGVRSCTPGGLAAMARRGKGGHDRSCFGFHRLLVVSAAGVVSGWTLASGHSQDRGWAERVLSARAGQPQLTGPAHHAAYGRWAAPTDWVAPTLSAGRRRSVPILADLGYCGAEGYPHWLPHDGRAVLTAAEPPPASSGHRFSRWRPVVETTFAHLCNSCGLKYPAAHTCWGLLTRRAAKLAAYNLALHINPQHGRPDFAFATLIA